jgi:protein SCO1/2
MSRYRLGALVVLGLLTVMILALGLARLSGSGRDTGPTIGGPFTLVDQGGAVVDQSLLRGKWSAVFFGYTYCPDVCPTTLAALGQASVDLGDAARKLQVVFITIDPARDSPKALAAYLSSPSFPRNIHGLSGTPSQIATVAKAYHVYYQKVGAGDSYTMDHSAVIYLMDPRGRFSRPLDPAATPAEMARQIRLAMAAG